MTTAQTGQRVALYARVSGEEQKQGHNIDSQIAEMKQFAAQREWSVVEVYQDEAWSGAALARPALDKLRDDAGRKLFDAVLINDVDRLARDVTHLGVIKRDLERAGVKVVFRKIPSENSPTHNLLVNILGSFAEFERELIMDRTRRGRRHKVEVMQKFIGCKPPYGYRYTPAVKPNRDGRLIVNPQEAAVVREMFNWVDKDGLSGCAVTLRLGREGIRPRNGGASWEKSTVTRILRAPVYCGTWHYNKSQSSYPKRILAEAQPRARKSSNRLRAKEEWIPVALPESLKIISDEQWQRVQQQLDRNRTFSPRNAHHEYLLSGLVRCGGCGAAYTGSRSHGRFEYKCTKRCKRVRVVGEDLLDSNVWNPLMRALNEPAILTKAITGIKAPAIPQHNEAIQLDAAIAGLGMEESRVLEAYRLSILTPGQLASELESIASRKRLLEKQRGELAQRQHPALQVQSSIEDYSGKIRKRLVKLNFETKRDVVRLLLRKVIFEGNQVRISGVLPLPPLGRIATTETDLYGRNTTAHDATYAEFVLVEKLAPAPTTIGHK